MTSSKCGGGGDQQRRYASGGFTSPPIVGKTEQSASSAGRGVREAGVGGRSVVAARRNGRDVFAHPRPALLGRPIGGGRALSVRHKTNTAVLKLSRGAAPFALLLSTPAVFICMSSFASGVCSGGSCRNSAQEKVEF